MAQLSNYLRSNRKRLALSQKDVAFLLGTRNGDKVCRYERFVRVPNLATALAYEVVFQKPTSDLFVGLHQQVQQKVAARAKVLSHKMDRNKPNRRTAIRRQLLTTIAKKSKN